MTINLPPVFQILSNSAAVTDIVGTNPVRIFLFSAPQGTENPYIVYHLPNRVPENLLAQVPKVDFDRVQFDVYAQDAIQTLDLCAAVRDALEPHGHLVLMLEMERLEPENLTRWVMDFNFWTGRDETN